MSDIHKRLKQYTVIAGGKLSKVIEFSRGEAALFAQNFIECRLSHAELLKMGGLKDLAAYFSDTNIIKNKLNNEVKSITDTVNKELEKYTNLQNLNITGTIPGVSNIKNQLQTYLEEARNQAALAVENVKNVVDDNDFNHELINQAKTFVNNSLENIEKYNDLIEKAHFSIDGGGDGNDESGNSPMKIESFAETSNNQNFDENSPVQTISLDEMKSKTKNDLNTLYKWQFGKFEEEFIAEIYTDSYHDYKYAKTKEELCELLNTAIRSLGADIDLDPEEYELQGTELLTSGKELSYNSRNVINIGEFEPETGITEENQIKNIKETYLESLEPGFPDKSKYYVITKKVKNTDGEYDYTYFFYRWYQKNADEGEFKTCEAREKSINIEEDIKPALKAAGIKCIRIDIDWHNKNYDPDEGFSYDY